MEISKLHQLKKTQNWKKKKSECILYIEMNEKVPRKIVRKIDIKNVTRVFN